MASLTSGLLERNNKNNKKLCQWCCEGGIGGSACSGKQKKMLPSETLASSGPVARVISPRSTCGGTDPRSPMKIWVAPAAMTRASCAAAKTRHKTWLKQKTVDSFAFFSAGFISNKSSRPDSLPRPAMASTDRTEAEMKRNAKAKAEKTTVRAQACVRLRRRWFRLSVTFSRLREPELPRSRLREACI